MDENLEVGAQVIVAVATNRGAEWERGYIDRFVAEGTRVRVKLDDGRILPACDPDAVMVLQ